MDNVIWTTSLHKDLGEDSLKWHRKQSISRKYLHDLDYYEASALAIQTGSHGCCLVLLFVPVTFHLLTMAASWTKGFLAFQEIAEVSKSMSDEPATVVVQLVQLYSIFMNHKFMKITI